MSTVKSILIVEDEALVAEDLKEKIISLGYTIAGIADNGASAIALAKQKSPDLITMDINLSGSCDGISTMEQIRRVSDVPVIYVTAFATEPILERAKRTKPSGYIIKPFNDRQVRTSIEIALHNYELERKVTERDMMIQTLINATENPLFLIDANGTILTANEAISVRARKTPEELQGIHVQQLIDTSIITVELGDAVKQALEGREVRFEESVQGYWFENLCIPVTGASGRVTQAAVFCNDISFRKRAENHFRTLNEQLIAERIVIRQTQEELRSLNTQLEEKVRERTAQLETSNIELIEQNRTLQITNAGSRALLIVHDEAGFIPQMCNDLIRSGDYLQVWLTTLDTDGKIGISAAAGEDYLVVSEMLIHGQFPACAEPLHEGGGMRTITTLEPACAGCPLSLLHMKQSSIVVRLDAGGKPVAVLGVTLRPGISPKGHETVRIGQIAQEIAFIILYLRTKEREQKAYYQITKNLEQLAILNDHIRNPLQGIIGYASMGEGELFKKIITLSITINSIVTKLDEGYLESKKIRDYMERHEHIVFEKSTGKTHEKLRIRTDSSSTHPERR